MSTAEKVGGDKKQGVPSTSKNSGICPLCPPADLCPCSRPQRNDSGTCRRRPQYIIIPTCR